MNADNFSQYLQDRSLLHQLPYEELKTLALQYPFCQPLQLLMLRKSLQDKRGDWEAALRSVATVTSDRSLLYAEMSGNVEAMQEEEVFQLSEDYLELNSFDTAAEELELASLDTEAGASESVLELDFSPGASAASEQADSSAQDDTTAAGTGEAPREDSFTEGEVPAKDEIDNWKNQELEALEATLNLAQSGASAHTQAENTAADALHGKFLDIAVSTAVSVAGLTTLAEGASGERMAPHEPLHVPRPSPRPKSSFTSWVAQFQPPDIQTQLSDIMESKKNEDKRLLRKKRKQDALSGVDEIVLQSITESGDLASETLAKVLAQQGQYDKAEEMYRRLMLVFPEKSNYFAQQILNLKSN